MPTYVYKFVETGETIEIQQSFEDDALTEAMHPDRGELMPVKKVFLPVGITFRGDGFYKTDSRASKSSTSSKKDGSGSDASSSSSSESSSGSDSSSASSTTTSTSSSSSSSSSSSD